MGPQNLVLIGFNLKHLENAVVLNNWYELRNSSVNCYRLTNYEIRNKNKNWMNIFIYDTTINLLTHFKWVYHREKDICIITLLYLIKEKDSTTMLELPTHLFCHPIMWSLGSTHKEESITYKKNVITNPSSIASNLV